LPEYNIVVNGKAHKVEVEKTEETRFTIKVDGKPFDVWLVGKFDYKTPFPIKVGEKLYNVEINKGEPKSPYSVKVNNVIFKTEVRTAARHVFQQEPMLSPTLVTMKKPFKKLVENGVIVAPMAGKIVSVKVKKGDSVKVGDIVLILEAMKMENEITATKAGTVQEIHVAEGTAVSEGDIILVIK